MHFSFHDTDQEVVYVVKPPRSFGEQDLGELPRTRYPLVVILLRNDEDDCEQPQETDVVRKKFQLNILV